MTAGDLKGEEVVIKVVTFGATVAVGNVVHLEADGKWDPVVDTDTGPFGIALDAKGDTETGRVAVFGRVETTATGTAIKDGAILMAGTTGKVAASDFGAIGENLGMAWTAFDSSGNGVVYLGLGV